MVMLFDVTFSVSVISMFFIFHKKTRFLERVFLCLSEWNCEH